MSVVGSGRAAGYLPSVTSVQSVPPTNVGEQAACHRHLKTGPCHLRIDHRPRQGCGKLVSLPPLPGSVQGAPTK